eukprot:2145760-Prymnesium_polylepis.1
MNLRACASQYATAALTSRSAERDRAAMRHMSSAQWGGANGVQHSHRCSLYRTCRCRLSPSGVALRGRLA